MIIVDCCIKTYHSCVEFLCFICKMILENIGTEDTFPISFITYKNDIFFAPVEEYIEWQGSMNRQADLSMIRIHILIFMKIGLKYQRLI